MFISFWKDIAGEMFLRNNGSSIHSIRNNTRVRRVLKKVYIIRTLIQKIIVQHLTTYKTFQFCSVLRVKRSQNELKCVIRALLPTVCFSCLPDMSKAHKATGPQQRGSWVH
jgi:hypothetical protein